MADSEILAGLRNELDVMHSICIKDRDIRDDILATLRKYAAIARVLESGEWKLVPTRPTVDMVEFGKDDIMRGPDWERAERCWREMLAAAPQFQEE
jgi:hypothetical protein